VWACLFLVFHYLVESWKNLWNCHPHLPLKVYSLSIFGFNHGHGRKSCFAKIRHGERDNHWFVIKRNSKMCRLSWIELSFQEIFTKEGQFSLFLVRLKDDGVGWAQKGHESFHSLINSLGSLEFRWTLQKYTS